MFEQNLEEYLQSCEILGTFLATYGGKLAVFNLQAPADTDENWGQPSQYARIVYTVHPKEDAIRGMGGSLEVAVTCKSGEQDPAEIEPVVRMLLDDHFITDLDCTVAMQWSSSSYFTNPSENSNGVTLQFSLFTFPKQAGGTPDVIALLNTWTKQRFPACTVIGVDMLPSVWTPTGENPAVYWRLVQVQKCSWIPETLACSWQTATIQAHIMAPDREVMASIARQMDYLLTVERRLIFPDDAPLMVDRNIKTDLREAPYKTGQLTVEGSYGVTAPRQEGQVLNHIYTNGKEVQHGSEEK